MNGSGLGAPLVSEPKRVRGERSADHKVTVGRYSPGLSFGGLAQLGERLVCIQEVTGSSPVFSTKFGGVKHCQSLELLA